MMRYGVLCHDAVYNTVKASYDARDFISRIRMLILYLM